MQVNRQANRDRAKSVAGVVLFHAAIGYVLIRGLGFAPTTAVEDELRIFDVAPEPPLPLAEPAKVEPKAAKPKPKDPEGAASPKNLRDTPSPIVAPPPAVVLPVISPVVAAPVAADGNRASAGASDVPGPGTGSGGLGTGLGSGSAGRGTGGGGGGGTALERGPRLISGRIGDDDYPRSNIQADSDETVYLSFVVATDGRVRACTVTRSSGNARLDETTCRLIKRRFRYRPARDAQGEPVAWRIDGTHVWQVPPEPPVTEIEPTIWE